MASSVNNPTRQSAIEDEGESTESPALAELYRTLGYLQAGIKVRQDEAEKDKALILQREDELIKQRDAAQESGDLKTFDACTNELDDLQRAWRVLTHDPDEELRGSLRPNEHEADESLPGGGNAGDGDDPGTGR